MSDMSVPNDEELAEADIELDDVKLPEPWPEEVEAPVIVDVAIAEDTLVLLSSAEDLVRLLLPDAETLEKLLPDVVVDRVCTLLGTTDVRMEGLAMPLPVEEEDDDVLDAALLVVRLDVKELEGLPLMLPDPL